MQEKLLTLKLETTPGTSDCQVIHLIPSQDRQKEQEACKKHDHVTAQSPLIPAGLRRASSGVSICITDPESRHNPEIKSCMCF